MLASIVYGTGPDCDASRPAISVGSGPSAANAGIAVEGVSNRSTSAKSAAHSFTNWFRRCTAWANFATE